MRMAERLGRQGQVDDVRSGGVDAATECLGLAQRRLDAADVLLRADQWEVAFTTAYEAYRTAADAVLLLLGYRVGGVQGAHRIVFDLAHAAVGDETDAFEPVVASRFRQTRNRAAYFDPARPTDTTADDARWAATLAGRAIAAVGRAVAAD